MRTDIETGPIEHRLNVGSLDRQTNVGGSRGAIERQHTQPQASEYPLPGSAVALHRVAIPSAGIPAVSFVITAIMPVRSPQEMKPPISTSNLPIRAVKARSNGGSINSLYCK
jgi:hypothetical protein